MSDIIKFLESEVKRLATEAKSYIRTAEDESRGMTEDETAKAEGLMAEAERLKHRMKEIGDNDRLTKSIEELSVIPSPQAAEVATGAKTLGEAFAQSSGYQALKATGFKSNSWSTGAIEFGQKLTDAGLTILSTGDAGGNLPLSPQIARAPFTAIGENKLVFASLFPSGVATQNTLVYLEETTTTPGVLAGRYSDSDANTTVTTTTEGLAKPAAAIDFTKRSKALQKLAAFLPLSDEMLEDEPAIVSYINTRLGMFIRQAEDDFIFDAVTAANIGSANGSDVGGVAGNWYDAIAAGILKVQKGSGLEPDAIVMSPVDYWKMRTAKASTAGTYFGDPFTSPGQNPWGLRLLVTNIVNSGRALVGAFGEGGQVWRKGGLTVEASNSHSDYFRKNLTAIRAEERLAVTIYRPAAFAQTQPA